ncbi:MULTISPECIES: CPBP family intramembrane glutamic endopeptidase [unclassified Nocardiopsis]|uniref:CPBP family intramembrane glutamic endopeptidase n=1 Tax=unclassified Nocardiopsis TaxID=2649073 RepID=UPI001916778B|nr:MULTISPECIES: CPBP family intramembrane glutamic endopeptidase [unclassified Nocardiopsis]
MVNADPDVWAWPPPRPVRTSQFACAELPAGESYHRLGRTSRFRWWSAPLTLVVLAVLLFFLWMAFLLSVTIVAIIGGSGLAPGSVTVGEIAGLAFGLLPTALLLPIVLFLVRVVQWRRIGSVLSVEGRLRWNWLARCTVAAVFPVALGVLLFLPLAEYLWPELLPSRNTGGTEVFAAAMAVIVLLVPFQSAAEELTLRGLLLQLVGAIGARPEEPRGGSAASRVLRSPGPAVLASGTLFPVLYLATHPGDVWTAAALAVLGLGMAWLTWRTGGLEAAIGLHVVNSLVQFTLCVFEGRMDQIGTGAVVGAGLPLGAGSPPVLILTALQVGLYVLAVRRWADRLGVRRTSPAPASRS